MSLQAEVKLREMEADIGQLKEKVQRLISQVDDLSSRLNPAQVLGKRKPGRPPKELRIGPNNATVSVGSEDFKNKGYVIK